MQILLRKEFLNSGQYWLLSILILIALIVIVGGLTRLTDSGLSITRWDLISGILPPMSISDWEKTFLLYKQIPEYKLLNFSMTLDQFKTIYWWEYFHRLMGRLVGILYVIPLLFFTIKKNINYVKKKIYSKKNNISLLFQIHSSKFFYIKKTYEKKLVGDGIITNKKNLPIGILTADCAPVLILDIKKK